MAEDEEEVPKKVVEEPNDEPAGYTVHWTIFITIVVLGILYFFIFYDK
ncbi:hypothetical protein [Sphingobacterium hungaricum]|nr:hypothetical protein [Sphingobacterium hungaricum]